MHRRTPLASALAALLLAPAAASAAERICLPPDLDGPLPRAEPGLIRFAQFNAFLNRSSEGQLISDLASPDDQLIDDDPTDTVTPSDVQARAVAEIIQRVRPDVLLLNEFDHDAHGTGIQLFQENFLAVGQNGQEPIRYPYVFNAPSNTGIPSGVDLNGDGSVGGPDDAQGFGFFPGQFGMVLLSKYPIDEYRARTFQELLWKSMPGNLLPEDYYSDEAVEVLRLSSKSHWDVPVRIGGRTVHVLAAHPTPPVFDGPEDRNGRRNRDEIRFWVDYTGPFRKSFWIRDDEGHRGGLRGSRFVILGDYNADPFDGDDRDDAAQQLLTAPQIDASVIPGSLGAFEDALSEGLANEGQIGNAAADTADFNPAAPGNLRADYVLPSRKGLEPVCGGVFWPDSTDATRYLVGSGFPVISSDHHLVWLDVDLEGKGRGRWFGWEEADH